MRNLARMAVFGAAVLAAPLMQPAAAGAIRPAGIGAELDGMRLVAPVHCRPGFFHHRFGRSDGCRGVYGGFPPYYAPYAYPASPYPYAYGYGPAVSFGFHFRGQRHHHHHHHHHHHRHY